MAFVGVEDLRVVAQRAQHPYSTDAQHDFLAQAVLGVAAIQPIGDRRDLGAVGGQRRIEQIQLDATDLHEPRRNVHRFTGEFERDLLAGVGQCKAMGVEAWEAFFLISVGVEPLAEVALGVEQPNGHERETEVGGGLQVVAGEDAEAAGILRQGFGEAELG